MKPTVLLSVVLSFSLLACGGAHSRGGRGTQQLLPAGSEAPSLVRVDQRGETVALRANQPTLLYFYPKDGTPGCTKEACAFRDSWQRYRNAGLRVIGVSIDSDDTHRKFAAEHDLPFSLISDAEHTWSDAFGVGRYTLLGGADERVSFLIDRTGKIVRVYDHVDPGVHAAEVIADARALQLVD